MADIATKQNVATTVEQNPTITINKETERLLGKAFTAQTDVENESKFQHGFLYDAVKTQLATMCRTNIAAWENAVTKHGKLHPTRSRIESETALLASKRARELKELADIAAVVMEELKSGK